MAHEITLEKAAEMAHQAEFICRLIEVYPDEYEDGDVIAIASLLAKQREMLKWQKKYEKWSSQHIELMKTKPY